MINKKIDKKVIIALVVLLAIGFAAVTTTLIINGGINIAFNKEDFDVRFTEANVDGTEGFAEISSDGKSLTFRTSELTELEQESVLNYTVSNLSKNYDADIEFNFTFEENEYVEVAYNPQSMDIKASGKKNGKITVKLKKVVTEPRELEITVTLVATPKSLTEDNINSSIAIPNMMRSVLDDFDVENLSDEILENMGMTREDYESYLTYDDNDFPRGYTLQSLMDIVLSSVSIGDFWDYKSQITKVVFENQLLPHETEEKLIFDVSAGKDGSVMAYLVANTSEGYTLYIQANGNIIANPDSSNLFNGFSQLSSIEGLEYLDTSMVTNMSCMFKLGMINMYSSGQNISLEKLDLSSFDTSNVTDMSFMFAGAMMLNNLDLSKLDTSSVTDMSGMFMFDYSMASVNLSNFNTQNVVNMSGMFYGCVSLTSLDLSPLDTSNVTDMSYMFGVLSVASLDLSSLDTSKVTNMSGMFYGCDGLTSLDLSPLDTRNVVDMSEMFYGCDGLTSLDLSPLDTRNVTNMSGIFRQVSLTTLDLSPLDTSKVTDMSWMFYGCDVTSLDLGPLDTSNVTNMSYMLGGLSVASLDLSPLDTSKVTDMSNMFDNSKVLTTLDLSPLDTSNVTNMSSMFTRCSSLTSLDLSPLDTSKVTYMSQMFYDCKSLTTLNLSSLKTDNVTSMGRLFYNCSALTSLDLSNFSTSKVKYMSYMFYGCSGLTSLDLKNFTIENVEEIAFMFGNCSSLTYLNISNFDFSNIKSFYGGVFNSMPTNATVIVKDSVAQSWILALSSSNRPASWTTANVVIVS